MSYDYDDYDRRRDDYLRDEYRRQNILDDYRRQDYIEEDYRRDLHWRGEEEYERKRQEESYEQDRELIRSNTPDVGHLLSIKYGFEDNRLLSDMWGRDNDGGDIEFKSPRFYEAGRAIHTESLRQFDTRFPKSTTQFVFYQVEMRNNLYRLFDSDYKLVARYYRPDGSLMNETEAEIEVESGYRTFWYSAARGWSEPGHWTPGTYRVEVAMDGKNTISGEFEIYDDVRVWSSRVDWTRHFK